MANFGNIEAFDPKNPEKWITYLERMHFFFLANDIVKPERRKAIFLTLIGAETYALARSLASPKELSFVEYDNLIKLLTDHFSPKPNIIVQRFLFNKRNQGDESVSAYIAELRKLSEDCEFVDLDDRLRDKLVCGLRNESLVKRLLSEKDLTFEKAVNLAICDESASADASHVQMACLTNVGKSGNLYRANSNPTLCCLRREEISNPYYITANLDNHDVHMLIDSGSEYSLLNKETFLEYWKLTQLKRSEILLNTWSSSQVQILGKLYVKARLPHGSRSLQILVADGLGPNILGRQWFSAFRLKLNFLNSLETNPISPDFEELFKEEIDAYNGPLIHIDIPDNAEPKFVKARTVPFALRNLVDEKLRALEEQGIIEPIKFSKWASPIVTVLKNDGTIRICHDYKTTVNLYTNPDKYPLPTIPQLLDRLRGGKVFTKLDMAQAYQQLKVDGESSEILTINTPRGLYRVKRLPFGLNSAVGTFQRFMDTILMGIDGVAVYLDDVLISGINCGMKIDNKGIHPSEEKLRAIKDARPPSNKKELMSFLGLLNYYDRFLRNKATVVEPLHRLLDSNNPWKWNREHQRAFKEAKSLISSESVLAHFDDNLPILVSCDASEYGIGAILSQVDHEVERPVVFASRTLNKTERRYAVIDKEALAVIFGVSKFSQYLLGRKFKILTDHKPLVGIFNPKKPIPQVLSPRMLRWCLTLAAYTYSIEYKPGKVNCNADALSRLPLDECPSVVPNPSEVFFIESEHAAINSSEVAKLTNKDPILSKVKFWAMNGWPERKFDDKFRDFVSKSSEISVHKDCLLWGSRVIIPERLRKDILNLLHDTHIGIVGTKALARGLCWWPKMDGDIERMISSCSVCLSCSHDPPKTDVYPWIWPSRPWSRLHIDHAGPFQGKLFLVVVDAYSKWIEAKIVSTTSTETTINCLKEIFATHGLPDVIVSDNGTSFTSELFRTFLKRNGVRHILCAPYHAASNGQVERAIQTLKNLLRKNSSGNWTTRLSRSLLSMRIAINSTTQKSPAQLLMNRNLKSLINKFHPEGVSEGRMRQEDRFIRNWKPHRVVNEGQAVIARGYHGPRWLPGVVREKTGPVSIKVETDEGAILNRHLDQVRDCGEREATPATSATPQESNNIEDPQAGQEIDPTGEASSPILRRNHKKKEGSGIKRKTATAEDRYLVVTAKRHREMTAIQLSNELSSATGTRISRQTVHRRLHEGALYARRPMVCVLRTWTRTSTYVFPRDAAERDLGCTETFDFSTPNEWPKWRKRFERYLVVSGMKKKEEAEKIDLFMYLMGDRADDIFRTFKFEKKEEATKIDSVLKAFDSHFCVRKNIIYERAKFNSRIQEDREPVDEFITSLYKLADSCEFEGLHEQLIRDRIVVGVRDKALSERMQLDSELTLEKAVKMVRQQEAVRQQQVDLQRPSTSQKVNQVKFNSKKQSPKQQQQPSRKKEKSAKTRSRCPKCGGFTHREEQACRAEGQKCNLCSKTGHFANCCPDKQAKTAEVKAVSELDEEIGFLLEVSAVEDSSNLDDDEVECRRRWTAEIQVNGKKVKFKLDSQADVTCVPLCLFKKIMGQQRLVESDINLRAAEFSELQTVGMFISTLRNGNYEIKEKIYVIRRLSEPLLSRRACELLNLARRIEVVATRINPIREFPEVFEGLGQIGNPYEIKLKPGAKPYAVHTPRRVPIPLMEKLKTRLEELERAGIIAQVNVATEWCAPTVIAGKPNGDIRLCVDLSRLNEHVQREVHPMPVVEHMLGQLGEARLFSKLDANSGFHQIPLSPDCQHLTTFITPFGRYKYCRMPFGISLAPEYFQRVMSIILQGMDGVMCYLDDILIFASDSKTHDRILRLVLRKLKEAKVTLNKAKCVFGVPRINFLGHILDEDGIRPDPAKIEAVAKMPAPTDVHGVRRFLGMVNHLGRFVENLSEIVAPLNQLLVKGQDFVWDCSQERAFRKLKELLTTQPILAAYDVRKPTMVSSDASSYGLGAVLKQEGKNGIWRPVAYSSRTMTPTEKRYAQIEKEALAITWACERFQDFLLGKRFRIETDHKPLIPLFSTKELSSLTPRLQRFRMRMMRFGFEIVHIPGKELLDADALSRQPLLTTEGGEDERPTSAHINAVLSSITDKDEMLTKIFEAQQEDTTLKAVANYLEQGWPDKKKMSQALLSYWHVKDELGVQNGLLMRSCRLVIPASMKLEILEKLHAGHFGITKTRLRARETVWWPGISEEIAETVRKCSVCIQEAVSKHEPLIPTNFPTRPWQKIGMDLFKFENKWYLVVIDYYSRFPEMVQLDRLTASVVVRSCKSIFARHGIPETVVSDNGTQFGAAREFANFARQYGFTHVTSSPRFPQSNGMAEAGVKIAKLILKKNQDPSLGLLEYRSTPLENGYSPAELLMGRKLRTTLPIAPENLNPKLVDSQALKRKEGRRRKDMKSRYDRRCGATDMEELSEGDTVWITDMRTWGIVKKKASTPRSYMVDTPVGTLRRNRFHLRKGVTVQYPADPSTPTFSGEELVENEKTPVVDYPSNDSEDGQIRTRSGRIVKPMDIKTVCIPLTSAHRRARLNWCLEHHAWTHDQWANVLFSDESRFSLNTDSRLVFIWREPGIRYHPSNIREIDSFRGGSLLIWAGISSSSRTPLQIFSGGTLTAQRYRNEILEPYLRPYTDQIGHKFIFMDDNARPHRARLVNEYLQSENIRRMDWPARSPDLNPIEHVWDALGRRIGARHPSPRTLVELRTALLEEWGLLPLDLLQSLVNSMRARCETLIAVREATVKFLLEELQAQSHSLSKDLQKYFQKRILEERCNKTSLVLQYLHNPQAQLEKKKMVKDFSVKLLLRLKPLQEQMAEVKIQAGNSQLPRSLQERHEPSQSNDHLTIERRLQEAIEAASSTSIAIPTPDSASYSTMINHELNIAAQSGKRGPHLE
ncbi:K02A2.6-like, partial [Cordylochernes scorpioides]